MRRVYSKCFFVIELALYSRYKPTNNFGYGMTVSFEAFCLLLFKAIDMFYDIFRVFFFFVEHDWK
jgi:hypothetical protein